MYRKRRLQKMEVANWFGLIIYGMEQEDKFNRQNADEVGKGRRVRRLMGNRFRL